MGATESSRKASSHVATSSHSGDKSGTGSGSDRHTRKSLAVTDGPGRAGSKRFSTAELDPDLGEALQGDPMEDQGSEAGEDGEALEQTFYPGDELPPGWESVEDGEGNIYYVNKISMETQWEVPTEPAKPADPDKKKKRAHGRL